MTHQFSFNAEVAAEAIEKVGRLFNASIDDILNELLQNARRAGATRVRIDQVLGNTIRITDNGAGLEDPRSLFSLGRSQWSAALVKSEDAAGMGFFALANRGATIIAQRKGAMDSWAIEATSDAFHGKEPVKVRSGPADHRGVLIMFPIIGNENIAGAARRAARYFPIPVILNGEEMPRSDFLQDADRVEEWHGILIGVFSRDPSRHHGENANFHGVTLHLSLPTLDQSWHRAFEARIDVVDCATLKLVLPARKEVVQNEMFHALQDEINRIYFQMIAAAGPHSLSFRDYQRGRTLGVDLKEAAPALRPFSPSLAGSGRNELPSPEALPSDACVYEGAAALEEQIVARAISRWDDAPPLFEPQRTFEGYNWYDTIRRIAAVGYRMMIGDAVEAIEPEGSFSRDGRPDRLEVVMEVSRGDASETVSIETDMIVTGPEYGSLDEMDIRVTRRSTMTPTKLQRFLIDALFYPSDDAEAGSYEQQEEWFCDLAQDMSIHLLESEAAADLNAIIRTVERELVWRMPKTGSVTIRIVDRNVSIEGLPASREATGLSLQTGLTG